MKIHAIVDSIQGPLSNGSARFNVVICDSNGLASQSFTVDIADTSTDPASDMKAGVVDFIAQMGYTITSADVVLWGGPQ